MLGCQKPCAANASSSPEEASLRAVIKGCQQKARYSGNSLKIDRKNALVSLWFCSTCVFSRICGNSHLEPSFCEAQMEKTGREPAAPRTEGNLNRVGSTRSKRPRRKAGTDLQMDGLHKSLVRQPKAKEDTNDRSRVPARFSSLTGPPDDSRGCCRCSARQTLSSDGSRNLEPSEIQT